MRLVIYVFSYSDEKIMMFFTTSLAYLAKAGLVQFSTFF